MPSSTPSTSAPSHRSCSDEKALLAAIVTSSPRLHALARHMLGDHHAAEDAVQEACLRALQGLDRYRGDASMATWLYRITANVCLDELRRRRRHVVQHEVDDADQRVVDVDFAETVLRDSEVANAMAALPRTLRAALVLTDLWGFNYADTSAILGVPAGTVGSRVHRAKASMRTILEPELDVAV